MISFLKNYFDYKLFCTILCLSIIGLISLYSATYDAGASRYFHLQIVWTIIGMIVMITVAFLPNRMLERMSLPAYAFTIVLLLIILILGKIVAGSRSWFGVGGIGGQPSEFAKVASILALAYYLSRTNTDVESVRGLASLAGILLLPALLVLAQPDTGTALVFACIALPILYWSGAGIFTVFAMIAPILAAIAAMIGTTYFLITLAIIGIGLFLMKKDQFVSSVIFCVAILIGVSVQYIFQKIPMHQQKRIMTFLAPDYDPLGAGYNILQAKVAIGSGGFTGKGFLHGTQTQLRFIPAQWTDFIYCVPSEEFGFIGASIILLLLGYMLIRGIRIASSAKSKFLSVIAIGVTSIMSVHIVINVGMVLGLIPVIGIPLPFLSYGGSSMIAAYLMIGLLLNVYANRKEY